jgi:hypothetical protein
MLDCQRSEFGPADRCSAEAGAYAADSVRIFKRLVHGFEPRRVSSSCRPKLPTSQPVALVLHPKAVRFAQDVELVLLSPVLIRPH